MRTSAQALLFCSSSPPISPPLPPSPLACHSLLCGWACAVRLVLLDSPSWHCLTCLLSQRAAFLSSFPPPHNVCCPESPPLDLSLLSALPCRLMKPVCRLCLTFSLPGLSCLSSNQLPLPSNLHFSLFYVSFMVRNFAVRCILGLISQC